VVEDTGKKVLAEAFKPLNVPEPIEIEENPSGGPGSIKNGRGKSRVTIIDCWRIDDEWWRVEPLSRMYYAVITEKGRRLVSFKDLTADRWFRQDY
jgi:hypothetical protein